MYKILFIFFVVLLSCNGTHSAKKNSTLNSSSKNKEVVKQFDPKVKIDLLTKASAVVGDEVKVSYSSKMEALPDSIIISINAIKNKVEFDSDENIVFALNNVALGKQQGYFTFYWGDTLVSNKQIALKILSNIAPKSYGYKVIRTFPHDTKAYTQGLEFDGKTLFEGTGQNGESTLTKMNLDKDQVLQQIALPSNVFGEGITILNEKVYQITWRSQTGFVYEKETLRKLYEFSYPTEGWGLCNNGKELIMSDGSENIYFLDTNYMQEVRRIQAYDDKGMINQLNELEYIDGLIYANVYGTDNIVAIDETSGKVMKQINLKGLLNKKDVRSRIDVLNGIAFDKINNRMIVTGKWWPKLYHVEFIAQ